MSGLAGMFAAVFIALYVGHMVGDHVAQTDWQSANKAKPGWRGYGALMLHVGWYGFAQAVALSLLTLVGVELTHAAAWAGLGFSMVTHGFIDRRWPVQWVRRNTGSEAFGKLASGGMNGAYLVDQTLHIACLFVAALITVSVGAS